MISADTLVRPECHDNGGMSGPHTHHQLTPATLLTRFAVPRPRRTAHEPVHSERALRGRRCCHVTSRGATNQTNHTRTGRPVADGLLAPPFRRPRLLPRPRLRRGRGVRRHLLAPPLHPRLLRLRGAPPDQAGRRLLRRESTRLSGRARAAPAPAAGRPVPRRRPVGPGPVAVIVAAAAAAVPGAAAGGDRRVRQLRAVHRWGHPAAGPRRAGGLQIRLLRLLRRPRDPLLHERRRALRGAAGRAANLQLHPVHRGRRPRHPLPQAPPRHHRRRRALRQAVPPQPPPRGITINGCSAGLIKRSN
jgi:hypothetical protein